MTKWKCGTRLRVTTINKLKWASWRMDPQGKKFQKKQLILFSHAHRWSPSGSIPDRGGPVEGSIPLYVQLKTKFGRWPGW